MRLVLGCLVLVLACTKPNPNRCCTDESDCTAKGIPIGNTCGEGLLCRGNQCISEPCASASQCDGAAPYCVEELCSEACVDDVQCPGFGQQDLPFCVGGQCVVCRDSADCGQDDPVCASGACRSCVAHSECPSDLCDVDTGRCIAETSTVYAAPSGSTTSACSKADPCTIDRALAVIDNSRSNIRLQAGEYSPVNSVQYNRLVSFAIYAAGDATISGGLDVTVVDSIDVKLRDLNVAIFSCNQSSPTKPRSNVDLARIRSALGVYVTRCNMTLDRGVITGDPDYAPIYVTGSNIDGSSVVVTRSELIGGYAGLWVTGNSTLSVSNSIIRGQGVGGAIHYDQYATASSIRFSTLYNTEVKCQDGPLVFDLSNNLFLNESAGAPANTVTGNQCRHSYDMITPQATAPAGTNNVLGANPMFVNAAAGDFHLTTLSPAIDAADSAATEAADFDGTARPQGAKRDVGAFEYKP